MKKLLPCAEAVVLFSLAVAGSASAQVPDTATPGSSTPSWIAPLLPLTINMVSAIPAPADDPLLDANGNAVLDSSGNQMSDPKETFHQVKPTEFDPDHTKLVQAAWLDGTGCPASSPTAADNCVDVDPDDHNNEGLLLFKTGSTANNAAAIAELKKVKGITAEQLTELGYDIRKPGPSTDVRGSHCGAGAPRFDVVTKDSSGQQHLFFIGCNSPTPPDQHPATATPGWWRYRWGVGAPLLAFDATTGALVPITGTVERIFIVFDEGQDAGPDNFGAAVLDNIDVNGQIVGRGPTSASAK